MRGTTFFLSNAIVQWYANYSYLRHHYDLFHFILVYIRLVIISLYLYVTRKKKEKTKKKYLLLLLYIIMKMSLIHSLRATAIECHTVLVYFSKHIVHFV